MNPELMHAGMKVPYILVYISKNVCLKIDLENIDLYMGQYG